MKIGDLVRRRIIRNGLTNISPKLPDNPAGIIIEIKHPPFSDYSDYRTPTSLLVLFSEETPLPSHQWFFKQELEMISEGG